MNLDQMRRYDLTRYYIWILENEEWVTKDEFREATDEIIMSTYNEEEWGGDYIPYWTKCLDEIEEFLGIKAEYVEGFIPHGVDAGWVQRYYIRVDH